VCGMWGVWGVWGVWVVRGVWGVWGVTNSPAHSLRSTLHRLHLLRLWTPTIFSFSSITGTHLQFLQLKMLRLFLTRLKIASVLTRVNKSVSSLGQD
jgi:hypothetical protein